MISNAYEDNRRRLLLPWNSLLNIDGSGLLTILIDFPAKNEGGSFDLE